MYRVRYVEQTDKLGERVHLSMLEEIYSRELLLRCVQQSERRAQKARRVRHFTGLAVLWLVLAMGLWSRLSQGRVWDKLTHWLQDGIPAQPQEPAGASAVAYQRALLGVEPLRQLFEQGTHVLGQEQTPGVWYQGYRLMALDGTLFNLPDTPANEQAFGRSRNQYGKGAYPQARVVLLTECGTHATIGLHIGRYDEGEVHGAFGLLPKLERGMLLLHDANFFGGAYLEALSAKGIRSLGALASTVALTRRRNLPDGSYLAQLVPNAQAVYPMQRPLWVRIIEYQLTDERLGDPGQVYRLVTTWLNPRSAPAKELIVLYHERWEVENVLDELKTHLRVQQKVLRSQTPEGVRQEIYGLFVVHFAIRALMTQAAIEADLDPDRLSFTEALFQLCEAVADERGEVSPLVQQWRATRLRQRLRRRLLPARFLRLNRRELKQVYHKYKPKKRNGVPPKPFEPEERFEDFVVVLLRPQGSTLLTEVTPMGLI
ncbi:MAG TPA: IS4 family transposase [Ktedonobacteraceae bacterium]|nr:IS4 family transposase [Ktedonobacteraceae bacterium]